MSREFRGLSRFCIALFISSIAFEAKAEVPVTRTFFTLPSSNGYGAVMVDLSQAKLTHFREHLFAREEPQIDASGNDIFENGQPAIINSRDLLYDMYFGVRANGQEAWLTSAPVDLDKSGYVGWASGKNGGTGVVKMVQSYGGLTLNQYFFAPHGLPHDAFVMLIEAKNDTSATIKGVEAFSLHNFHMGYGRPDVMQDIQANGETITWDANERAMTEQGFAGVTVAKAIGTVDHHGVALSSAPDDQNLYQIVNAGGAADLPDSDGGVVGDDEVSAFQFSLGDVAAGASAWAGVVVAHHGDPFEGTTAEQWIDAYVGASAPQDLLNGEVSSWKTFQGRVQVPKGASADEETLVRHEAAMIAMAQNQEDSTYLREFLTQDGEPRASHFSSSLPGEVTHVGKGQILASLPPGEWTIAWARDSAYSIDALATVGLKDEAKAALVYELGADAGRFQNYNELMPYSMPPYQVSLCRYYGFGVEETDFNANGPNLEFDGMGSFLWALRRYEVLTKDTSVADMGWSTVTTKIADVLVDLIDPSTGLLKPDSSIWETHWDGDQRTWTYSNITAARGLCDAADIATRKGDAKSAKKYSDAGKALRGAIANHLTDMNYALASNAEELADGNGYWDAAVWDGVAMGLFDPKGVIAKATYAGIDKNLVAPAGAGWSRNDDRYDHQGGMDTSPWGSEYDSAEWVFTDMRGAVAMQLMGDTKRRDRLIQWVGDQTLANYLAVSETYDEGNGTYKFNAPMVGFGAGSYILALAARAGLVEGPACGAYFDESGLVTSSSSAGGAGGSGGAGGKGASSGGAGGDGDAANGSSGCSCELDRDAGTSSFAVFAAAAMALAFARSRRMRRG